MNSALKSPATPTDTRQNLAQQLGIFGVGERDVLFLHANIPSLQLSEGIDPFDTVIGALTDVLGEWGTVLTSAFRRFTSLNPSWVWHANI